MKIKKNWANVFLKTAIILFSFFAFYRFLIYLPALFSYPLALEDAESIVANLSWRLAKGLEIYRNIQAPPYLQVCYPPVYLWILSRLIHPEFPQQIYFWGRLLSVLGCLGTVIMLSALLRFWKQSWRVVGLTAALYFSMPLVLTWQLRVRVDILGVFFMLLGMYFYLRFQKQKSRILRYLYIFPLWIGVYTKHALFAVPLTILVHLCWTKNRDGLRAFGLFLILVFSSFIYLNVQTQGEFFNHIVRYTYLPFGMIQADNFQWFFYTSPFLFLIGGLGYFYPRFNLFRENLFLSGYLIFSFLEYLCIWRTGTAPNFAIEFATALTLGSAFFMGFLLDPKHDADRWFNFLRAMTALGIFTVGFYLFCWGVTYLNLSTLRVQDTEKVNQILKQRGGKIFADDGQWPLLNHEEIYLDPFGMTMLVYKGLWDQRDFLRSIERQEFNTILLRVDPTNEETWDEWSLLRLTREMMDRIGKHYDLIHCKRLHAGFYQYVLIYAPKQSGAGKHS